MNDKNAFPTFDEFKKDAQKQGNFSQPKKAEVKAPVDTTLVDKYDNRYWVDKSVALQSKVMRQREKIAEFD